MKTHRPSLHPSGLTLLELLVVLTILVALSTVAITSTSGVADQARYEATQRTLENIRDAVIGPANLRDTDGTLLYTGFVADTGRLPRAVAEVVEGGTVLTLAELVQQPAGMAAYQVLNAEEDKIVVEAGLDPANLKDPEVMLGVGWRGPYLRLSPGTTLLRDGWGADFILKTQASVNIAAVGESIGEVHSFGANATENGADTGYEIDQSIAFHDSAFVASISVTIEVRANSGNLSVANAAPYSVRLFEPDASTGMIRVQRKLITLTTNPVTLPAFTSTAGIRALRAYDGSNKPKSGVYFSKAIAGQNAAQLIIFPTVP